jgi:hypothetical protein
MSKIRKEYMPVNKKFKMVKLKILFIYLKEFSMIKQKIKTKVRIKKMIKRKKCLVHHLKVKIMNKIQFKLKKENN